MRDGSGGGANRSISGAARRVALLAATATCVLGLAAPAARAAFGVQSFTAGVLVQNTTQFPGAPACDIADASVNPPTAQSETLYATQAGSHPYCGFTSFAINSSTGLTGATVPDGTLKDVRVDLPPGLVPDPHAVPQCAAANPSSCPAGDQVGTEEIKAALAGIGNISFTGANALKLYNMDPASNPNSAAAGAPADFAFEVPIINVRVDIVGGVRDVTQNGPDLGQAMSGDFGEYFTIENLPQATPTVSSTLTFFGDPSARDGGASGVPFLTNPSTCAGPQRTYLSVDSYESPGQFQTAYSDTPVGASGCASLTFPVGALAPSISLTPGDAGASTFQRDTPSGLSVDLSVPQDETYADLATPQIRDVSVTLPPGFTINPAAASTLQACGDAQFGAGGKAAIGCPAGSVIGTASITSPALSAPLTGNLYLGAPLANDPYRLFLDAEGDGLTVRLAGSITPDPTTGRLTTTFSNNPQVPFSDLRLQFNGGPGAVVASSLACGAPGPVSATLTPWSGATAATPSGSVAVAGDEHGAGCPSTPAFSPTATATYGTLAAGAKTLLALTFSRRDGQQYFSQINASLPPGLLGLLSTVPLCPEPAASGGSCPASSQIGTTTVSAGSGAHPLTLSGPVYLTGPYGGAPFGLSIPVLAAAGPYNLGTVVVRAAISVSSSDAHLSISSTLPQTLQGIPLRLRAVTIAINRNGFLFNPTSCAASGFGGAFAGSAGASAGFGQALSASAPLAIPFAATGCSNLAFAPRLSASTLARTSSAAGASLDVTIAQPPGGSNLRSVAVTLPKQFAARLSTVQQACPAATFAGNPTGCPASSLVGSASASTPVLTAPLTGPVYLVAHAAAALPTLEVVLAGSGITVDLSGTIAFTAQGRTSSTFAAIPDVPISQFHLDLPEGPHSALGASGSLCAGALTMPATLVGQTGRQLYANVAIRVSGCPRRRLVVLLSHRFAGGRLHLRVRAQAAGRVSVSGPDVRLTYARARRAGVLSLTVRLDRAGLTALRRHRTLHVQLRLGFVPVRRGAGAVVQTAWTIRGG